MNTRKKREKARRRRLRARCEVWQSRLGDRMWYLTGRKRQCWPPIKGRAPKKGVVKIEFRFEQ